ncbi:hypothetical protein HZC00_03880 [Candidatus Kaiserbacteria bacterium]|nr:hypothetical protein [Candidatus Kaiserbacteria bacterium]
MMYENTARVRDVMAARRSAFQDRSKRSKYKQSVADLEIRYAAIRDQLENIPDHLSEGQCPLTGDDLWFFLKIEDFVKSHLEHEGRVYKISEIYTKANALYKKLEGKKQG